MFSTVSGRVSRLGLLAAAAGLLTAGAAGAQQAGDDPSAGYAPAGAYRQGVYAPYGYSQGPYASYSYNQGPYAAPTYGEDRYGRPYDPYAAQRRAWRRRQAYEQQQAAYTQLPPPPAPPPAAPADTPAYAAQADPAAPPLPPAPPAAADPAMSVAAAPAPGATTPADAPQSVALAHRVVESASAYLAFMQKASRISAAFTDGESVAKEVKTGASYEAKQFEEGAIAYAAIMALQEPSFIEGVRAAAAGDQARGRAIADQLLANPDAAATFTGADVAAARASAALRRQGDRLMEAAVKVKQSAYDVQHSAWSKTDVANPELRLAAAKTLSTTRLTPAREETDKLLKLVLAEQGAPMGMGSASPLVNRGLAVAALAVLGQAGEDSSDRIAPLLTEERGGECLKMAKLNLFQCLAVAGPHYEDIFCLGQHAMMDTAQCVIKASGASRPVMTASAAETPTAATPEPMSNAPQDYWVPVAGGSGGARK